MGKLNYGYWIRRKALWLLGGLSLAFGLLAALPVHPAIRIGFGLFAFVTLASFLFPLYSYFMFSPKGGNLQDKFYEVLLDRIAGGAEEKVLDIGTGNGILAIEAARRNLAAEVIGVDYWGKEWEYSRATCESNAGIAGVEQRVQFRKGDAASLNFPDETFDAVMSNLTFHEVKLVKRKSEVLREALRVLKPGGRFAFIDYFYEQRFYGATEEFKILLWGLKLAEVELEPLDEILPIPRLLRHPRALGRVGIVYGKK